MAKNHAVWGIDIGQCALKALRCRPHDDDSTKLVADSFDYIEYPKILSQPDAEPAALVADALKQFLARNEVRGSRVAISVSGQSGLARFIKLPPVESKKIPDIVKFEAKQQIPFALDDVVWDYQQMVGGSDEEGFALETEVGLFAMKRDQVMRALAPLDEAGIDVDYIQLTPLAICNYAVYDVIEEVPPPEEYDPEDPPPSTVVLSLGTDTTDLVVTNGYRVWQRSIPIGGNHFTKAISKELRLTFSKAEHLKRNATKAEDPKVVYKAMRSVFSDLLAEVQRSIGYFSSIDRHAKIGKIVALGNAMRLPGLKKYLTQNLEQAVTPVESFRQMEGPTVTEAPQFQENILSFGVCYGLCLQGLGRSKIYTNLLPGEILTERLVREKKPWAVGAAAAIFIACTISFGVLWAKWSTANVEDETFKAAFRQASTVKSLSDQEKSAFLQATQGFQSVNAIRSNLLSNVEGRLLWLELIKAINEALPQDPADNRPENISQRKELHVVSLDCEKFEDLSTWYTGPIGEEFQKIYAKTTQRAPSAAAEAAGGTAAEPAPAPPELTAPTGEGWVIQVIGYHFHNEGDANTGPNFVRNEFVEKLRTGSIMLPTGPGGQEQEVKFPELGISHPIVVTFTTPEEITLGGEETPAGPQGRQPATNGNNAPPENAPIKVRKSDFLVQFCWKPTPPSQRAVNRQQAAALQTASSN